MPHLSHPAAPTRAHVRTARTAVLGASILLAAAAFAQQAPAPAAPLAAPPAAMPVPPGGFAPDAAATRTGRLQRWLVNPNGQVDGFLLADGMQVNVPPHLSADLLQAARPGDTVQVQGWAAPNAPVVRAVRVVAGNRSVEDAPPALGSAPPLPPDPSALTAMTATGRVARLLYTPRGDANGVLLDNGGIVRFPPHVGNALVAFLQPGQPLFARGWGSSGPQGSALAATALGPSAEGARELFAGPGVEPALPGPRGPHRPPRGPHGAYGPAGMPAVPPAAPAPLS